MPTDQLSESQVLQAVGVTESEQVEESPPRPPRVRIGRRFSRAERRLGRRAVTTSVKAMRRPAERARAARLAALLTDEDTRALAARPTTREECRGHAGPCPWVGCKYHLYLDVNPETGSIKLNFSDLEPWELRASCALDVAERGSQTLDEVGDIMNLTKERIRQIEIRGMLKLKAASPSQDELGARPELMRLVKVDR